MDTSENRPEEKKEELREAAPAAAEKSAALPAEKIMREEQLQQNRTEAEETAAAIAEESTAAIAGEEAAAEAPLSAEAEDEAPAPKKRSRAPFLLLGVLLLLAAAYLGLCAYAMTSDTVFPNTYLEGTSIDLGGKTPVEVRELLEEHCAELSDGTLTVVWEKTGAEVRVPFADIGFRYDAGWTGIYAYWMEGRENFLTSGAHYLRHLLLPDRCAPVPPAGMVDETFEAAAQSIPEKLGSIEPVDFSAVSDGAELVITKARSGLAVMQYSFADELGSFLQTATGTDLVFTVGESLEKELYAEEGDLAALRRTLVGEMKNARYDHETGGISPSRIGAKFSLAALEAAYAEAEAGETFRFNANITYPTVTTEMLEESLFRDLLSGYTTRVGGAPGRHENVRITAERINGVILNPGETMKYGPLVTPFTAENGYFPAPGYLQGKTVDMVGGGACQASSTLYAAVLYANLEIVQRVNHGFASDYIGLGMDATVAEGGPEFEWRNNTNYPIRVDAEFFTKGANDYIRVSLHGTEENDYRVEIDTEILSTTPYGEEIVETDELPPGEQKVEQTPYNGYDVKTYRCIYDGEGNLLSRSLEARSVYRMRNRVIHVGKAAEPVLPAEPVEPIVPIDPTLPVDPVLPVDPADPALPPVIVGEEPTPADPYVPPAEGSAEGTEGGEVSAETPAAADPIAEEAAQSSL